MLDTILFPCTHNGCYDTVAWAGRGRHPKYCNQHRVYRPSPSALTGAQERTCIECGGMYRASARLTCSETCREKRKYRARSDSRPKRADYCLSCTDRTPLVWSGQGRHPTRCARCKSEAASRQRRNPALGTCGEAGCEAGLEAKGLCSRHYKRTRPRTPDKPKTIACVVCGKAAVRSPSSALKYGHTCSRECTTALIRPETCELPADHWARTWGATCALNVRNCARCEAPMTSRHAARIYCGNACAHPSTAQHRDDRDCECCGVTFTPSARTSRWCSPRCTRKGHKQLRRAREYQAQGSYTTKQVRNLWHLFGEACAYCSTPTSFAEIEAEHVVALSKGGANDITNLLVACRSCNTGKGTYSLAVWAERRARQGKPPVTIKWSSDDPRYKHLKLA